MYTPKVILLSASRTETDALRIILEDHVRLTTVNSFLALIFHLNRDDYDAIFCGQSCRGRDWEAIMVKLQQQRPELPVIVFGDKRELNEWEQVIEAGAFDLIEAPYRSGAVLPVLEHAVASREARRWHHAGMGRTTDTGDNGNNQGERQYDYALSSL